MTTPAEVRQQLVEALQLDLVGPTPEDALHAEETIPQAPSLWYLTGFLVPYEASLSQRSDDTADDELDEVSRMAAGDDETTPEAASARKALFPSSMGLSFLVPKETTALNVCIDWGDYSPIPQEGEEKAAETRLQTLTSTPWQRTPRQSCLRVSLGQNTTHLAVPSSDGLELVLSVRQVNASTKLPAGTQAVSLFLVNYRPPAPDSERDIAYIFQAKLTVQTETSFVPRPDLRGQTLDDEDERIADLQYRNDYEFAVGHNVSAVAVEDGKGHCTEIRTAWIPAAEVEKVIPSDIEGVELGMEALSEAADGAAVRQMVEPMVTAYAAWIAEQRTAIPQEPTCRVDVTEELLHRAHNVKERIAAGLNALDEPDVLEAFRITNRAIATSIRQRSCHERDDLSPDEVAPPQWRPFQLAFLLMNIVGLANPTHPERQLVDLLFFPTGGGKTEAYLGLAAFTMVLRRLRHPGIHSAGLSVLMRYTLRLLTLDQLGRASTLICALELERQQDVEKLGRWPFEIGLWVGQTATPNRMGKKGDKDEYTARARTLAYINGKSPISPIPLENCPWCGTKFTKNSFQLLPDPDRPADLRIICVNRKRGKNGKPACPFRGAPQSGSLRDRSLPILAVDDPIYRRLPAFIIATVDKFANLPWVGETGALFGRVSHYNDNGFYGPATVNGGGRQLDAPLPPPDLIVQDELHLISGPLGTMVGLYETAIDSLCSYEINGVRVNPKIVASTATVRRATSQIRALFGRSAVEVFPPPGPDRRDSFFAKTVPVTERHGRRYLGIAAQGRSLKVVLMRSYLALLGAAQKAWKEAGGEKNPQNPADPYMTLVGYFNSLRELGGSRRIVEDEVKSRLESYSQRRRENETEGLFDNRTIGDVPLELTSRVSTGEVAEAKSRLAQTFKPKEKLDVVLATNMISVGLDITRLGLMVVLGQPKTVAEYIQATSRVGRDDGRPGLVVTLLNVHRPRDRSHYERFQAWHNTFYRAVEATSVTPFSPRAIDRGLAAITVALARLGCSELTAPLNAVKIVKHREALNFVVEAIAERAEAQNLDRKSSEELRHKIRKQVIDLLDSWMHLANDKGRLQYQREVGEAPPLLFDPLDPDLDKQIAVARKFKAQRSLRDVEPTVNLWVQNPDGFEVEEEENR